MTPAQRRNKPPADIPSNSLTDLSARLEAVSQMDASRFGIERDTDWFTLKLTEEVGELVGALLRKTGRSGPNQPADQADLSLRDELADVAAHTLLLARHLSVDLAAEIDRKWLSHLTADDHLGSPVTTRPSLTRTTSFRASWGQVELSFVDYPGDGLPVVFIHGLGGASSLEYAAVAAEPRLAGRRLILVDLAGSGLNIEHNPRRFDHSIRAHARLLDGFLVSLGLNSVVLYGHSMGGAIALSLASLNPERVAGIMLSEANLDAGGGKASQAIAKQTELHFAARGHAALLRLEQNRGNPWATTLAKSAPRALHREACSLVEGVSPSWREILYQLTCPKTYIFGQQSLSDDDLDELPRHQVSVATVDDAGHNMAWENPAGLAQVIADFSALTTHP